MTTESTRSNLTKLSKQIAHRSKVPPEVVERVLSALIGLVIETTSKEGKFVFPHLFSISVAEQKLVVPKIKKAEGQYDDVARVYENKAIMRISLSKTVRRLFSAQQELWADQPGLVNAATWRDAIAYLNETEKWSKEPDATIPYEKQTFGNGIPIQTRPRNPNLAP